LNLLPTYSDEIILAFNQDKSPRQFSPEVRGTDKQVSVNSWRHVAGGAVTFCAAISFHTCIAQTMMQYCGVCNLWCGEAWIYWNMLWLYLFYF